MNLAERAAEAAQGEQEEIQDVEAKGQEVENQDVDPGNEENSLVDLDGLDKFKYGGEEWTQEDLHNAMLRQSDYTKKTQDIASQRKEVETQQKFFDNFWHDAEQVRRDPALAAEFKNIYPESFHDKLDRYMGESKQEQVQQKQEPNQDYLEKIKSLEDTVNQVTTEAYEREVEASEKYLDTLFTKLGDKYQYSDEDAIIQKAMKLLDDSKEMGGKFKMTEAAWGRLFRQDHDMRQKKYDELYQSRMNSQLERSKRASDVGAGGVAPGQQPKRMSFAEATEAAIEDLRARNN